MRAQGVEAHAPEGHPLVERLACALLSNARGVWRCLCLEAPYMSTICASEFLKALEVFLHTHANLCRGREQ